MGDPLGMVEPSKTFSGKRKCRNSKIQEPEFIV